MHPPTTTRARSRPPMPGRPAAWLAALLALGGMAAPAATAMTVFGDGGRHALSGPAADIGVRGHTTLSIEPGADVSTTFSQIAGAHAVTIETRSRVTMSGGRVAGGDALLGGFGYLNLGWLSIADGTVLGGPQGGHAVFADGRFQSLRITGGVLAGGDGLAGGRAVFARGGIVRISGGDFSGGIGLDGRYALTGLDGSSWAISGGLFRGDFELAGGSLMNVLGTDLDFRNGLLSGTLADGSPIAVNVDLQPRAWLYLNGRLAASGVLPDTAPPPNVPLPPAAWLFLSGLLVFAGFASHRRPARAARA